MKKIKVGVVGVYRGGSMMKYCNIADNAELVAICDKWVEGLERKKKELGTDTIACSASNMWACLTNVISWGIPEEEAVRAATYNPACAISADDIVGSIAQGKRADFIITDAGYTTKRVFLAGKEI